MEKPTIKERLRYWLDNQIARGTGGMILWLFLATLVIVALATIIICLIDSQNGLRTTMWNNAATAINQWVPTIEEEDISWSYYIVTGLVAIAGLFITSVLIGIISSGIETRLFLLRGGRRSLLEKDHIIILGAENAELFVDAIKSFTGDVPCHVVIADSLESEEFDDIAALQKQLPQNVKLHVRNVNIRDKEKLRLCSIPDARAVIINAANDDLAIQSMISVSAILRECPDAKTSVVVGLSSDRRLLPEDTIDPRILQIQLKKTTARLLLRFCNYKGLAGAVMELMNSSTNKFHIEETPMLYGKSFGAVLAGTNGAIPIGVTRDNENILMPPFDMTIEPGDRILFFGLKEKSFNVEVAEITETQNSKDELKVRPQTVVYIGSNRMIGRVIGYLQPRIRNVVLVPRKQEEAEFLAAVAEDFDNDERHVSLADIDPFDESQLLDVIRDADQVSFIPGDDEETDNSETDNVVLLHKIKSLCSKEKLKCSTNIMLTEPSWTAMDCSNANIFVYNLKEIQVKILLKSVLQPETQALFTEMIEQSNHDLILNGITEMGFEPKDYSVGEIRTRCMQRGSILLGYVINTENNIKIVMNPILDSHVTLSEEDSLIILK